MTQDKEWDLEKIQQYISNGIEENINLDYKGAEALGKSDGKKKEISKDVSAFANSDGGTIIYGVLEFNEPEKNHLPEKINSVDRTQFSKEWIEQIINSGISPKIHDIKITSIDVGPDDLNKVIYVVDIPKSNTAHQAKDKRYYRRYNFESIMMDDWEIKDIINRTDKSSLTLEFRPINNPENVLAELESGDEFFIEFALKITNVGNTVCKYMNLSLTGGKTLSEFIVVPLSSFSSRYEYHFSNKKERSITINDKNFVIANEYYPLLPGISYYLGKFKISSKFITEDAMVSVNVSTENKSKRRFIEGSYLHGLL